MLSFFSFYIPICSNSVIAIRYCTEIENEYCIFTQIYLRNPPAFYMIQVFIFSIIG